MHFDRCSYPHTILDASKVEDTFEPLSGSRANHIRVGEATLRHEPCVPKLRKTAALYSDRKQHFRSLFFLSVCSTSICTTIENLPA